MKFPIAFVALSLGIFVVGCGKNRPATYGVLGTVYYQNAAVAGADVVFLPKEGTEQGKPARARTNASGQYSLRTFFSPTDDAAGALAGEYVVTVTKMEDRGQIIGDENFTPLKQLLPAKYGTSAQSPLTATVTSAGLTGHDLRLED